MPLKRVRWTCVPCMTWRGSASDDGAAELMSATAKRNDKAIFMESSCAHESASWPRNVRRHQSDAPVRTAGAADPTFVANKRGADGEELHPLVRILDRRK